MIRERTLTVKEPPQQEHEHPSIGMRDFADFITDLAHGAVNQKLTEKLRELAMAVGETQKNGSMTLKISLKQDGGMAVVSADIACKKPEKGVAGTLFFFAPGGALTREDPRQLKLKRLIDIPTTAKVVHSDPED